MPSSSGVPRNASPRSAIRMRSGSPRISAILDGFLGEIAEVTVLPHLGLRPFGPGLDEAELDLAARSGRTPRAGDFGLAVKKRLLLAQYRWSCHLLDRHPGALVAVWNGIKGHRRMLPYAARERGHQVMFFEESPLPGRISIDPEGVNQGCSLPRDIGFYHAWLKGFTGDPEGWRRLRDRIEARASLRPDEVSHRPATDALKGEKFLFCPLQVPEDSQLTVYGGWIGSVEKTIEVLHAASRALPEGWHLRLKEHPSAKESHAERLAALADDRFRVDNRTDTFAQVDHAQAVITVNSSVGLQAFLFDKPVIVLGQAFYALPGLAEQAGDLDRLKRLLADPAALRFDPAARRAYMSYLDAEYYPLESDVIEGRYRLDEVLNRPHHRA